MSISTQTDKIGPFIITGLPQVIPVSIPFQAGDELIVYDTGANGTTHDPALVLTYNSDYTVTGGGYDSANTMQTGSITVVSGGANDVLVGDYLVIARNVPINQTTSFQSSGPLTIQQVEQALDKQATLSQQVNEVAGRALRFEEWEFSDGVLLKTARAGKLLGFDENGNVSFSVDSTGGGGTYTAGAGLQLVANEFSVLPDQTFDNLTVTNPINGDLTGNAATATALETARTINGISFDGTANITVPAAAGTLTGTSLASNVVSSSLTSVAAGTIGTMAIQNANAVAITGGTINGAVVTGLADGVNPTDAVNLQQLQGVSAGIILRTGVVAATTANITLSAPQTIDGQAVIAGNRVLVKNQTLPAENGIYDVAAGAWSRSSDSNTAPELLVGYTYFVSSGTVNGASTWSINVAPTVLNTDPVGFVQFSASQTYSAGTGLGLAGNVFSLNSSLSGLTITSSAFNGTIGATTPSSAAFTTQTTTGNSYMANLVIKANQLNEQSTNGTSSVNINYDGYAGGTSQFRDLVVYDGKNAIVASFTGSSKGLTVVGGVTAPFMVSSAPLGSFTAPQGLYGYYDSGGGFLSAFSDTLGTMSPLRLQGSTIAIRPNGVQSALFTSTGLNSAAIGATTPSTGKFTTLQANGWINVKSAPYNATGDGSTNDTAAIAAAVAALASSNAILYFPPGTYITDAISITGKTGLKILGDGYGVSILEARTPSQVLNISSSNHVTVSGLTFDGSCVTRTAGQQAVIFDASQSSFCDNEIINSGEYAFFAGSGATQISDLIVSRNLIRASYADGINFQNVTKGVISGNVIDGVDDDLIAIGYNGSGAASQINVVGNYCRARNDLGTTWGRGIWVGPCSDILVADNIIDTVKQTGVYVNNDGTGTRPTRITVRGNKIRNVAISSGHGIAVTTTAYVTIDSNTIENQASGNSIEIADWLYLTIQNNTITQAVNVFARGIHSDEGSSWALASWDGLVIAGNTIRMLGAATNSCIYLVPNAAYTMNTGSVTGNTGQQVAGGDYITISTARMGTLWKIGNNVVLSSNTVSPSASAGVYTVFNNN